MQFSVTAIQKALKQLGYLMPHQPEGNWDSQTAAGYRHAAQNDNQQPHQWEQPGNLEQCTPSVRAIIQGATTTDDSDDGDDNGPSLAEQQAEAARAAAAAEAQRAEAQRQQAAEQAAREASSRPVDVVAEVKADATSLETETDLNANADTDGDGTTSNDAGETGDDETDGGDENQN